MIGSAKFYVTQLAQNLLQSAATAESPFAGGGMGNEVYEQLIQGIIDKSAKGANGQTTAIFNLVQTVAELGIARTP